MERVAWLALGVPCKPGALWELAAVWRVAEQLEQAESLQVVEHLVLARAKPGAVQPRVELRDPAQLAAPRPGRQRKAPAAAPAAWPGLTQPATTVWRCSGLSWLPFVFAKGAS